MIRDETSFGQEFSVGGAHSGLICGATIKSAGVYRPAVLEAMRLDQWVLVPGPPSSPPSGVSDLYEWEQVLVRSSAMQLLDTREVDSVLGVQVANGDELTAIIQEVRPRRRIVASDGLMLFARLCVIRTSAPNDRDFYTPLFFTRGAMAARGNFVELAGGYTHETWTMTTGLHAGYCTCPLAFRLFEHQMAQLAIAASLRVHPESVRINFHMTSPRPERQS